jgi:hypothetical protein
LAERKKHGYFEEADKIGLEADQIAVRGRLPLQLHSLAPLTSNIAECGLLDREGGVRGADFGGETKGWGGGGVYFPRRRVKIFTPTPEENTNTAPTTLSAIQAASQATFINELLYSTCDYLE